MIKINGHTITPTRFPDGTSQVWKLPPEILGCSVANFDWRFEHEGELMELASAAELLRGKRRLLHVPFLPYGRQDKDVSNEATFNFHVFSRLLRAIGFDEVVTVDAHNAKIMAEYFGWYSNLDVTRFHSELIDRLEIDAVVFPDAGAAERYKDTAKRLKIPAIVLSKQRNPLTGAIEGHAIGAIPTIGENERLLILDDICDGGATFLSVAKLLRQAYLAPVIHLFVTHGIFSKGREILVDAGITVHTTNSLPKNQDGFEV